MDSLLRQLDTLQELLYSVEEFLEDCKENEVIEFLSDHWKECILGGIGAYFAISYSTNYVMVSSIQTLKYEYLLDSVQCGKMKSLLSRSRRKKISSNQLLISSATVTFTKFLTKES